MKAQSSFQFLNTPVCVCFMGSIGIISGVLAYIFLALYISSASSTSAATKDLESANSRIESLKLVRSNLTIDRDRLEELRVSGMQEYNGWVRVNNMISEEIKGQEALIQDNKYQLANDTTTTWIYVISALSSTVVTIAGGIYDIYLYYALQSLQTSISTLEAENKKLQITQDSLLSDAGYAMSQSGNEAIIYMGLKLYGCAVTLERTYVATAKNVTKQGFRQAAYNIAGPTLTVVTVGNYTFGGFLKVNWKDPSDNTAIADDRAFTFSMRGMSSCWVMDSAHAVLLNRANAVVEFGEGEIIVYADGSAFAANGHDYYCVADDPDTFYYEQPSIPQITQLELFKVTFRTEGTECQSNY